VRGRSSKNEYHVAQQMMQAIFDRAVDKNVAAVFAIDAEMEAIFEAMEAIFEAVDTVFVAMETVFVAVDTVYEAMAKMSAAVHTVFVVNHGSGQHDALVEAEPPTTRRMMTATMMEKMATAMTKSQSGPRRIGARGASPGMAATATTASARRTSVR